MSGECNCAAIASTELCKLVVLKNLGPGQTILSYMGFHDYITANLIVDSRRMLNQTHLNL